MGRNGQPLGGGVQAGLEHALVEFDDLGDRAVLLRARWKFGSSGTVSSETKA